MGSKFKYIAIGLFLLNAVINAQTSLNFQYVDSLTYKYYNTGKWDDLIKLGNEAINNGIDYKYLRQRLGFAFFSKEDYFEAKKNFLKATSYDSFDKFTLLYLYYSILYTTQSEFARSFTNNMPPDLRSSLSMKPFQLVESMEFEYNYKYGTSTLRSNPQYFHIGVNSFLGDKLELYQMFSYYNQNITLKKPDENKLIDDRQSEYYALMKFRFSPNWMLKAAYHNLNPGYDSLTGPANLGFLEFSANSGQFSFAINASVMKNDKYSVVQSGIQSGIAFSGNLHSYFTGILSMVDQQNTNMILRQNTSKVIYNQTAGFRVSKKTWLEGNLTFGNLTNYQDHDAMYVYNLIDPTTFRAGVTLFVFCNRHITLWANYAFEKKEYYENGNYHYNQFSYLGGIKWKL